MGLDIPSLDDRTYEELREAAVKRIPAHAPEWTDHNAHDPGITILELLAWVVERDGYRLDRITDDHWRRYLALVGVTPRPPTPASVELVVPNDAGTVPATGADPTTPTATEPAAATDAARDLPARTPIIAETPDGDTVPFETTVDVALTPATLVAVVSVAGDGRTDHTAANERDGRSFHPFGSGAATGNALNLGFDADPFVGADRLDLTVAFDDDGLPDATGHPDDPERFVPSIEVAWERLTDPGRWWADDAWESLETVRDGTNAFHVGGRVELSRGEKRASADGPSPDAATPDDATSGDEGVLGRTEPLVWIRAVARPRAATELDGTRGPPRETADGRALRYELPPRFESVRPNVVPATQRERAADVPLERLDANGERPPQPSTETTGRRSERFAFPKAPVQSAAVLVGGDRWTVVEDFAASGPTDDHVVLDHETGEVVFGDGRHGTIPEPDQPVHAETVVYGGGRQGNVPDGTRWRVDGGDATAEATRVSRATGGEPAETIPEAFERARRRRKTRHRAVTRADYREIGARTPGVRVGRIEPIVEGGSRGTAASTDSGVSTGSDAANAVTVVAVPYGPPGRRPVPTPGFLDAVDYQLRAHSLLTDRVRVVAPTYVGVRIGATLRVASGATEAETRASASETLASYVDPVTGFDGEGWPFDRAVHRSDLFEVLGGLPSVADVVDVTVTVGDEGDLEADPTTVPYLASVSIEFREERRTCGRGI